MILDGEIIVVVHEEENKFTNLACVAGCKKEDAGEAKNAWKK